MSLAYQLKYINFKSLVAFNIYLEPTKLFNTGYIVRVREMKNYLAFDRSNNLIFSFDEKEFVIYEKNEFLEIFCFDRNKISLIKLKEKYRDTAGNLWFSALNQNSVVALPELYFEAEEFIASR